MSQCNNYFIEMLKGGHSVDKDFEEFIVTRCQRALDNDDYLSLDRATCEPEEVEDMQQRLCYRQGFIDAMKIFMHMM